MATWASLTQQQQDAAQSMANAVRGLQITWQHLATGGQVVSAAWNGGISDIVNGLDSGEIIPNASGLAGAQGLAKADLINMVGYLIDASNPANVTGGGGYNTAFHAALRVKACGINASLSG